MAPRKKTEAAAPRFDDISNVLTGLMIENRDPRFNDKHNVSFINQGQAEAIYQSSDLAARTVDLLPEDMMREGFKIVTDDQDAAQGALKMFTAMQAYERFEEALKLSNLYGGAGVFVGVNDGRDPSQPINENTIRSIDYIVPLDRWELVGYSEIEGDVRSENYGLPKKYQLVSVAGSQSGKPSVEIIDASRIIRFDGAKLFRRLNSLNNYWGDSVLSRVRQAISDFDSAFGATAIILKRFSNPVFKLKNLSQLVSSDKSAILAKRLKLISLMSSVLNATVIQDDEEYELKSPTVSGLPELLDRFADRIVSATGIPHTILMGDSAGGLGSTGEAERRVWYDKVKAKQESTLMPKLRRFFDLLFKSLKGPTGGVLPEYEIEFNPLYQPTLKEELEARKLQSDMDANYIDRGVLFPEEVMASRFGTGTFSFDTVIDSDGREEPKPDDLEV